MALGAGAFMLQQCLYQTENVALDKKGGLASFQSTGIVGGSFAR
jgi:hypothetical protein